MAISYPRKQTFFIFLTSLIAVGATALYIYGWPSFGQVSYSDNSLAQMPISATGNAIDSAVNTDWQKQFYTNDKSGSYKAPTKTTASSATKDLPLTATDLLGRNFFTKYVELRQAGLTNDTAAVNNATKQLIADSVAGVAEPKKYTLSDVKIISADSDLSSTKAYAQKITDILKSSMPVQNEAEVTMNAFDKGDMSLLKNIDVITNGYKSALAQLLATPVTQALANDQLDLINGLSLQIFNARALRRADVDPVTALAAISLEVKSLQTIATSVGNMQNFFAKAGISFVPPVSGSILQ